MKWYKIVKQLILAILLGTISSCVTDKPDPTLAGKIYLNEQTQARMEFTKKGTVVITWSSDEGYWKDFPREFSYAVDDGGREIRVFGLTSSQALYFPYETIEISDSKDRIIVTRRGGHKELFMKISQATEMAHTK